MSHLITHAISLCLIGTGGLAWTFAGHSLVADHELKIPLNPMGINGSPYGEVFAMAMQGPIDTYFDVAMNGTELHEGHSHADGEKCNENDHTAKPLPKSNLSLSHQLKNFIDSLNEAVETRTNPKPASKALRFYLRRQAEDKLRFAYNLDPSHYGNYNSLHFFLSEPEIGTHPELTPSAAKLAQQTIQYCLKQENDPRPALTAAAACTNLLHLMFADRHNKTPKYTTAQMRQCLQLLDQCLIRYDSISRQWDASKNWDLLSNQRITECQDRLRFISKIRDAAEKTIIRFEHEAPNP